VLCRAILGTLPPDELAPNTSSSHPTVGLRSSNASVPLRGPLLPELALLPVLESLKVLLHTGQLNGGIPAEWVAPNAFPRLKQ
jgi:hypothetical protein